MPSCEPLAHSLGIEYSLSYSHLQNKPSSGAHHSQRGRSISWRVCRNGVILKIMSSLYRMSGSFVFEERSTTIRQPSTANLMVSSRDRTDAGETSAWDFQISRGQNLINGFFTRIGTTEVVLDWCQENVSVVLDNDFFVMDLSGTGGNTYSGSHTFFLPDSSYTVAELLNEMVVQFNNYSSTSGATMSITSGYPISLDISGAQLPVDASGLAILPSGGIWDYLDIGRDDNDPSAILIGCPDLRPYYYLDFLSPQLTYAQDVKDSSTNTQPRDVLVRWYFSEDVPEQLDSLGFPILMGYKPFSRRRIFNPPKQIKWTNSLPVGNLSFQVVGSDNKVIDRLTDGEWLMTLQLSEN